MGIDKLMQPRTESERPPSQARVPADAPRRSLSPGPSEIPTHELPATPRAQRTALARKARRPKPITDPRLRKVVSQILALKVMGHTRAEIAEQLQLTENTVKTYLFRARKKGYLTANDFDDPHEILDTVIKPKVVENIERLLDWRHSETGLPSMDMTIETAKGLGVFQNHSVAKGSGAVMSPSAFALKVQIQLPPGATTADVRAGSMGGTQAIDGEVLVSPDEA